MELNWDPNNRTHLSIHVAMLELVEEQGISPEEVKSIVLSILDDTMPEVHELYEKLIQKQLQESFSFSR